MRLTLLFVSLISCFPRFSPAQILTAESILEKSISFHDPEGIWPALNVKVEFSETRPQGPDRKTIAEIDNRNSFFKLNRNDTEIHGVKNDSCFVIKGDVDCDRAIVMRNYYTYLWGLPMKLKDPGTKLDSKYAIEKLNGTDTYVLRIAYEKDTWYYYIRQEDFALIAYKFYQDAEETKGELITTKGFYEYNGLKMPNNRSWYTIPENKLLGTDILVDVKER